MPASENSKQMVIGVATQNYHSGNGSFTAPTTYLEQQLVDFDNVPVVTQDTVDDEMDGDIAPTSPAERLGIYTAISGGGRLRSDNVITLMKAAGLGVSSTADQPVVGADEHVLTPVANDGAFPWTSFLVHMGSGSNQLKRIAHDVRLSNLTLSGDRNSVARVAFTGNAGHEEVSPGTETLTQDGGSLLTTVKGSFTLDKTGGGTLAGTARSFSISIDNEFPADEDNFEIGNHEFDWQTWLAMTVTGTIDTRFNKTLFEEIFYGGSSTAGSGYDFDAVTGNLDLTLQSAAMITGSTPYAMQIEILNLTIEPPDSIAGSGRSELRMVIPFRAYVSGGNPLIRVTVDNDTTSY